MCSFCWLFMKFNFFSGAAGDHPTWYFSHASSYKRSRWHSSQNGVTGEFFGYKFCSKVWLRRSEWAFTTAVFLYSDFRSQIATVVLAAREEIIGVIIGGVLGHALCTGTTRSFWNFKPKQIKLFYCSTFRSRSPRWSNDRHKDLCANGHLGRGRRLPLLRAHGPLHGPWRLVNRYSLSDPDSPVKSV